MLHCQTCSGLSSGTEYWFWAYGHEAIDTCDGGVPAAPIYHSIGASNGFRDTYAVFRTADINKDLIYSATINGTDEHDELAAHIETCWLGGPQATSSMDEVFNQGDQAGGSVSSHQSWMAAEYMDDTYVWHNLFWNFNVPCSYRQLSTMGCMTSGAVHNNFSSWDTRF